MREYGRDCKPTDIETRSLENCPHIINNPISGLAYPSAQATSRSLPRSGAAPSRNPSLISNPLDGYLVDNELAGLYARQRRRSAGSASHEPPAPTHVEPHNSRANAEAVMTTGKLFYRTIILRWSW